MRTSSLAVSVLLAGCAVGPDFKRPDPPAVTSYVPGGTMVRTVSAADPFGAAQRFDKDADIPGQWWTLFHSQPLNDLIEQSIKANPNMTAAQAALRQARENTLAQKGAYYPQPQPDANRGTVAGLGQRQSVLQPGHAAAEPVVRAGRVRCQHARC